MKTKKMLVVDDDMDVVTMVETILRKEGYEVISANDKTAGMEMIRSEKPDLALLDVMMSTHYEGFELAKEILDDPQLSKIPVLMQTSIEVLTTTRPDVQAMAVEFRKNPDFKELHVILIRDITTGKAGVDYLSESGQSIWFPVDGFLRKPVNSKELLPAIKKILG
jgi:CheY-like chemotaxis protein